MILLISWCALFILPAATFWVVTRSARNLPEDKLWIVIPYGAGIVLAFLIATVVGIRFGMLVQPFRNGFLAIILSILFAGVAAIPATLIRRHSNKRKAAIISVGGLVVLFLLSTWDMVPGYIYYRYLCAAHGGVKIHRQIGPVEGYLERPSANGISPHSAEQTLRRYGHRYIETEKKILESPILKQPEKIIKIRYRLDEHGKIKAEEIDTFASQYEFIGWRERELALSLWVFEHAVLDIRNNYTVAEQRTYRVGAGRVLKDVVTDYGVCPADTSGDELLRSVLRPK